MALLRKNMYGLRDVPKIWLKVVQQVLQQRDFRPFVCTQCTFLNPVSGMLLLAHVHDFLMLEISRVLSKISFNVAANLQVKCWFTVGTLC